MTAGVQTSSGRRNTHRNTRPVYGNDYVQGSAAPKLRLQTAPKRGARLEKPSGSQSVQSNYRIRRNQERTMYMDLPYVIMPTIVPVFVLYFCINCLHVQSSITTRMYHVEQMEAELGQFRTENDTLETSINTSIGLSKIYETTTKELGVVYAKRDQVLLYDRTESEYIRQYEDILEH